MFEWEKHFEGEINPFRLQIFQMAKRSFLGVERADDSEIPIVLVRATLRWRTRFHWDIGPVVSVARRSWLFNRDEEVGGAGALKVSIFAVSFLQIATLL